VSTGLARLAPLFFACLRPANHKICGREEGQHDISIPARAAAYFILNQAHLAFGRLQALFDC
jgi:hypothetical protein